MELSQDLFVQWQDLYLEINVEWDFTPSSSGSDEEPPSSEEIEVTALKVGEIEIKLKNCKKEFLTAIDDEIYLKSAECLEDLFNEAQNEKYQDLSQLENY